MHNVDGVAIGGDGVCTGNIGGDGDDDNGGGGTDGGERDRERSQYGEVGHPPPREFGDWKMHLG